MRASTAARRTNRLHNVYRQKIYRAKFEPQRIRILIGTSDSKNNVISNKPVKSEKDVYKIINSRIMLPVV